MDTELPYGGQGQPNSGWAGSEASATRARTEDADGTTARRQQQMLNLVSWSGRDGVTVKDARTTLDLHHGQASAALSNLHKAGRIARLTITRDRCSVYVLAENTDGREAVMAGHVSTTVLLADMAALLTRWQGPCVHSPYSEPGCIRCDTREVLRRYEARS